ncbi:MAG: FKBP-type peptidyl-prolyl cis-trans isomerase [Aureispira sp.]|nr:FKBP-type peptidyl-prolyl cis-trans isomerase [Aureispira sp.]
MKFIQLGFAGLLFLAMLSLSSCEESGSGTTAEATIDTFSYSYGVMIAKDLKTRNVQLSEIDIADFSKGIQTLLDKGTPEIEMPQAQKTIQDRFVTNQPAPEGSRLSYCLGLMIGNMVSQLKVEKSELDMSSLESGFQASLANDSTNMKIDEISAGERVNKFFQAKQQAMMQEMQAQGSENLQKGQAFLAENGQKEGIQTTESGLQYEVITEGTGAKPTPESKVKTHYHGTLLDGTVFDSSVDRGEPISFNVGGVIQGWQEALQLMPVGSKWRLFIPSNLAYGERGSGSIPPNSALIFEVELIEIES